MKNKELKNSIQDLKVGDLVWNVCGLAPIVEIIKTGYSDITGSYCYAKTRFSKDSTMTFSVFQTKAILKDGYLCNTDYLQFIPNHKEKDFINQ
jgi:hypothetical protein